MVSTRGVRYKFSEGERVLCYEPDPTKAKVLYDSKVLEVIENKDKRGRRTIEYLIHFQGWNSSWDRCVGEDFVLKDTEENRQLQRDLAEKSQLQLGAYLYRRERKKGSTSGSAGSSAAKRSRHHRFSDDGSSSSTQPDEPENEAGDCEPEADAENSQESPEEEIKEEVESESSESSGNEPRAQARSPGDHAPAPVGRAHLNMPAVLRDRLTFDYHLIVKRNRLTRLPASPCAAQILESFVKWFARAGAWHTPRCRNEPPQKPDLADVSRRLNLVREVADGMRVYFDFIMRGNLLYKPELAQYHQVCGQFLDQQERKMKEELESDGLSQDEYEEDIASAEEDMKSPKIPEYSHLPPDPVQEPDAQNGDMMDVNHIKLEIKEEPEDVEEESEMTEEIDAELQEEMQEAMQQEMQEGMQQEMQEGMQQEMQEGMQQEMQEGMQQEELPEDEEIQQNIKEEIENQEDYQEESQEDYQDQSQEDLQEMQEQEESQEIQDEIKQELLQAIKREIIDEEIHEVIREELQEMSMKPDEKKKVHDEKFDTAHDEKQEKEIKDVKIIKEEVPIKIKQEKEDFNKPQNSQSDEMEPEKIPDHKSNEDIKSQNEAIETQSQAIDTHSQAIDTRSQAIETNSPAIDTHSQAIDTHSPAIGTHSEALDRTDVIVDHGHHSRETLPSHASESHHNREGLHAHDSESHHSREGLRSHASESHHNREGLRSHASESHHSREGLRSHAPESHHNREGLRSHASESHHNRESLRTHASESHHNREGLRSHASESHHNRESLRTHASESHHNREGLRTHASESHHNREGLRSHASESHHNREGLRNHVPDSHHNREGLRTHDSESHHSREGLRSHASESHHNREGLRSHATESHHNREGLRSHASESHHNREGLRSQSMEGHHIREGLRSQSMEGHHSPHSPAVEDTFANTVRRELHRPNTRSRRGTNSPAIGNNTPTVDPNSPTTERGNISPGIQRGNNSPTVQRDNNSPSVQRGNNSPSVQRGTNSPALEDFPDRLEDPHSFANTIRHQINRPTTRGQRRRCNNSPATPPVNDEAHSASATSTVEAPLITDIKQEPDVEVNRPATRTRTRSGNRKSINSPAVSSPVIDSTVVDSPAVNSEEVPECPKTDEAHHLNAEIKQEPRDPEASRPATRSGNVARRLRSHKSAVSQSENEEPQPSTSTAEPRNFEHSSSVGSGSGSSNEEWSKPAEPAAAPTTSTRTPLSLLLDKVSKYEIIPREGTEHLPCRVYGAIHLARLFVRLPDFLNATQMSDFKLKLVVKHIDMFIQYLVEHKEWFGEKFYYCDSMSRST